MFQHRLHDAVGTFAVLGDLLQVAGQHGRDVLDLCALLFGQRGEARRGGFLQFAQQIHRQSGEVVDEVERVLDLVRDAGRELAERGHLLGLYQPVLGAAQVNQRSLGGGASAASFLEQACVLDGEHRLAGEGLHERDDSFREALFGAPTDHQPADHRVVAKQRHSEYGVYARQHVARIRA